MTSPRDFITVNLTSNEVSFVVMNAGADADDVTIPIYHYQSDVNTYTLLDRITFTNVSSNRCVIGTTQVCKRIVLKNA